jgi:trehalose synthase
MAASPPILEQHRAIAGQEAFDQLCQLVEPLKQIKIVNVSSTKIGGGVAEILAKMVPLMNELGINAAWEVIEGSPLFFNCTKSIHNALQGIKVMPSGSEWQEYENINRQNAERLQNILQEADIVIIHDPQTLPLLKFMTKRSGKWIWRCHVDASQPYRYVWNTLQPLISLYDAAIFSLDEFAHPLPIPIFIIAPSIDPLSDKNCELSQSIISSTLDSFGLDQNKPLLLQVSRYDRFKDPIGVIEAYRHVKKIMTDIQLVLAGGGATDDPEGELILQEVKRAAQDDKDIHVLLLPGDAHLTINALQRGASIILQKSIKEGFGLTVTEALWKAKPVIGGNVGGIKLQIIHGQTGFLVNTPEGAAYRIRYLLQQPAIGYDLGRNGKEFVREKFLITRHIREYLTLIYSLLHGQGDRIELSENTNMQVKT